MFVQHLGLIRAQRSGRRHCHTESASRLLRVCTIEIAQGAEKRLLALRSGCLHCPAELVSRLLRVCAHGGEKRLLALPRGVFFRAHRVFAARYLALRFLKLGELRIGPVRFLKCRTLWGIIDCSSLPMIKTHIIAVATARR